MKVQTATKLYIMEKLIYYGYYTNTILWRFVKDKWIALKEWYQNVLLLKISVGWVMFYHSCLVMYEDHISSARRIKRTWLHYQLFYLGWVDVFIISTKKTRKPEIDETRETLFYFSCILEESDTYRDFFFD